MIDLKKLAEVLEKDDEERVRIADILASRPKRSRNQTI